MNIPAWNILHLSKLRFVVDNRYVMTIIFMVLDCKNKDNDLHVQQHYDIRINLFKNFFCFVPVYMHQPTKRIIV